MTDRPLVSFLLITYQQAQWAAEALAGALAQRYSPLEIIVADDGSTDGTRAALVAAAAGYPGPHRLVLVPDHANLGLIGNVNAAMARARGELMVAAAGDDVSLPHRVAATVETWIAAGRPQGSVFLGYAPIFEAGPVRLDPVLPETFPARNQVAVVGARAPGCSHAWHRALYDRFGPLPEDVPVEDKALAFRAALLGGIVYQDIPVVQYRLHGTNLSRSVRPPRETYADQTARAHRGLRREAGTLRGFAHDVIRAHELGALPAREARDLLAAIQRQVARREHELGLEAPDLGSRLTAALAAIRGETATPMRPRRRALQLLAAFFPALRPLERVLRRGLGLPH